MGLCNLGNPISIESAKLFATLEMVLKVTLKLYGNLPNRVSKDSNSVYFAKSYLVCWHWEYYFKMLCEACEMVYFTLLGEMLLDALWNIAYWSWNFNDIPFRCSLFLHLLVSQAVTFSDIFPKARCLTSEIEKVPRRPYLKKIAMNVIGSNAESLVVICPMNEMVWKQEYQVEKIAFVMTAIILNILSFNYFILFLNLT